MSDDSDQQQDVRIEPSWKARLGAQFAAPHMAGLGNFLRAEKAAGKRRAALGKVIHNSTKTKNNLSRKASKIIIFVIFL